MSKRNRKSLSDFWRPPFQYQSPSRNDDSFGYGPKDILDLEGLGKGSITLIEDGWKWVVLSETPWPLQRSEKLTSSSGSWEGGEEEKYWCRRPNAFLEVRKHSVILKWIGGFLHGLVGDGVVISLETIRSQVERVSVGRFVKSANGGGSCANGWGISSLNHFGSIRGLRVLRSASGMERWSLLNIMSATGGTSEFRRLFWLEMRSSMVFMLTLGGPGITNEG